MDTLFTEQLIQDIKPDKIILATGATPIRPNIQGIELQHVVQGINILIKRVQLRDKIIVLGGGLLGFKLGEYLVDEGKKASLVEQFKDVMVDTEIRNKNDF